MLRGPRTPGGGWPKWAFWSHSEEGRSMTVGAVILCGGESRTNGPAEGVASLRSGADAPARGPQVSTVAGPVVVVAAPGQDLPRFPTRFVARDPVSGPRPAPGPGRGARRPARQTSSWLTQRRPTSPSSNRPGSVPARDLIGDHDLALPHCDGYLPSAGRALSASRRLPAIEQLLRGRPLRPVS